MAKGNPLKKIIRRGIRATKKWLQEEPLVDPNAEHNYDQDDFAYPWLNSLLMKIVGKGDGLVRPHFTWGVLHGVHLAKTIGVERVSVIEFGVAGGNGLISLERIAEEVEPFFGVGIDVYGFDTGAGLPKPEDYRDLPNLYIESAFPMDVEKLKKRLNRAQLVLGLVEDTVPEFIKSNPAPVAFISFDLDYYSSTMQAFRLLDADQSLLLPRIHCHFDDIMAFTFSEFTGERLAISEFNASHQTRKISPIYGLRYFLPHPHSRAWWSEQAYLVHIFDHPLYNEYDGLVKNPFRSNTNLKEQ